MDKLKWWWFCCWNPEWCKKHFCRRYLTYPGDWACGECERELKEMYLADDIRKHHYAEEMRKKLNKSLGKFIS